MTINQIINYVMETPNNTNRMVLTHMLESLDITVEEKKYSIKEIVDYVMNSSYNTNRAILIGMIKLIDKEGGGEDEWLTAFDYLFTLSEEWMDDHIDYEGVKGILNLSDGDKVRITIKHLNSTDSFETIVGNLDSSALVKIKYIYGGFKQVNIVINYGEFDDYLDFYEYSQSVDGYFESCANLNENTVTVKVEYQKQ